MTIDDDGYDRRWSYRAFSSIWTERDVPETGQRLLAVHRVDWHCPRDWPLEGDVIFIEDRQATPCDVGLEAAILAMPSEFDKPAMIKAEWQGFFDHSAKC
jgi:hypothetical protein